MKIGFNQDRHLDYVVLRWKTFEINEIEEIMCIESLYKKLIQLYFEKLKKWDNYERYHGQILGKISETFLLNNRYLFAD